MRPPEAPNAGALVERGSRAAVAVEDALRHSLLVVPCLDGAGALRTTLPSLRVPPDRVLVLDGGSTDDTASVCAQAGIEMVRLGQPRSYVESCNVGIEIARQRRCAFMLVARCGIRFVTDVARELIGAALSNGAIAMAAPSKVVLDGATGGRETVYRARWDLSRVAFSHEPSLPPGDPRQLEADFCDTTCALLRMSVAGEIGGFDEAYGDLHADADFGFRLRQAGYRSVYLPHAQIHEEAGASSPPDRADGALGWRSRNVFAQKFLGLGVSLAERPTAGTGPWCGRDRHLRKALRRNGLLDPTRPSLSFGAPGTAPRGYLHATPVTDRLPDAWRSDLERHGAVLVPSWWSQEVIRADAPVDPAYMPLGVETDIFNPWGPGERLFAEPTFLWLGDTGRHCGPDVMLEAWSRFRTRVPAARLILMGRGVVEGAGCNRSDLREWKQFLLHDDDEGRISRREVIAPLAPDALASILRGVDALVCTSRGGALGFRVAEAMACGTAAIIPAYGGCLDLLIDGSLAFGGRLAAANLPGDPGRWWEPDVDAIVSRMEEACRGSEPERASRSRAAADLIRNRFTWRHTAFHLRAALESRQERRDLTAEQYAASGEVRADLFEKARRLEQESGLRSEGAIAGPVSPAARRMLSGFDAAFYRARNPDVAKAGLDPLSHYVEHGWREGRDPSPDFTTGQLILANPDARRALLARAYVGKPRTLFGVRIGDRPSTGPTLPPVPTASRLRRGRIPRKPGILFTGYFEAGLGLGQSARGLATAFEEAGLPFALHPHNRHVAERFIGRFMQSRYDLHAAYDVNVIELAPGQLPAAMAELGPARTGNSHTILRPYWELERLPASWAGCLDGIHEVWAPTAFVAQAIRPVFPGPVAIVPPVVDVSGQAPVGRDRFGLEAGRFYVLLTFDYNSSSARKNPLGAIRAFQAAFRDRDEAVGLVVKSTGEPGLWPRTRAEIAAARDGDSRIVILDDTLSRAEILALLSCCDAYLSLHRSEGFGLGMAEAMALGKPVVATDYSGNRDFLSVERGYPVAFDLRTLRDGEYPHGDGQTWAEPNPEAAAAALLDLYRNPDERSARARAGQLFVGEAYGRRTVAGILRERLPTVTAGRSWRRALLDFLPGGGWLPAGRPD